MDNIKKVIKISKKKVIMYIVLFIVLIVIALGLYLSRPHQTANQNNIVGDASAPSNFRDSSTMSTSLYPYQNATPSINDTREFMKTNYDATIQTRNVKSILRDIKGVIKVANGRIDSLNENPKNGYVRFVIPKVNFETFKDDIESITNEKLVTENISSENLLNQKQSIEQQQQGANNSLLGLQQQQKELTAKHTQTKNKLQNELADLQNQFIMVPTSMELTPTDWYIAQKQDLSDKITQKNNKLHQKIQTSMLIIKI